MKKLWYMTLLILILAGLLPGLANAADKTPPQLVSATINKDKIKLKYNESLSLTKKPETSAYSVKINGVDQATPKTISIIARTVTIKLITPAKAPDTILLSYQPYNKYLSDLAGNKAADFIDYTVTNNTPDTEAPVLQEASINETQISLNYNESLNSGSIPAASTFSIKIGETSPINPATVAINGQQVNLSLAVAVKPKQNVSLSYKVPITKPIKDSAGNKAAAISNQPVNNQTLDLAPPELSQAIVNGENLNLTYSENLDSTSVPGGSDLVVKENGIPQPNAASIVINQQTINITLARAIKHEDTITIDYTPGTNPIKDEFGNPAPSLSDQAVINNTPDITPPSIVVTGLNKDKLQLEYNEELNPASIPATSDYQIKINKNNPEAPATVSIENKMITLTLSHVVNPGDKAYLNYTPGSNPIKDQAGNPAQSISNLAITNGTIDDIPPQLASATINRATLQLKYNEDLNPASIPASSDFIIKVNTSASTSPNQVSINASQVKLTLSTAINAGDTVKITYTPGSNPIKDRAGNPAAALTDQSVENTIVNLKHDYIYDRSNRMINLNSSQNKNYQYQYDNNGNLLKKASH